MRAIARRRARARRDVAECGAARREAAVGGGVLTPLM